MKKKLIYSVPAIIFSYYPSYWAVKTTTTTSLIKNS